MPPRPQPKDCFYYAPANHAAKPADLFAGILVLSALFAVVAAIF